MPSARVLQRWWIYQRDRFPLAINSVLIAIFSFAAVSYAQVFLPAVTHWDLQVLLTTFVSSFCFFLLLRIADEFKDYEQDCRYRPYRPVPQGIVTLQELKWLGFACLLVQLAVSLHLSAHLTRLLIGIWLYFALMCAEFFVPDWLKAHPLIYLFSHMMITPLIGLYAVSCRFFAVNQPISTAIWPFLIICFGNGLVIELGRKIRCPEDEEEGVETYSKLWGCQTACIVWLAVLIGTASAVFFAAEVTGITRSLLPIMVGLVILAAWRCGCFMAWPTTKTAHWIEGVAALWTLGIYGGLGVLTRIGGG